MNSIPCDICKNKFLPHDVFAKEHISPSVFSLIQRKNSGWNDQSNICENCLDHYRVQHLQELIEEERGELTALDERVLTSLHEHEIVTQNMSARLEENLTWSQKLSDGMATFGGSWPFLILFSFFIFVWIGYNEWSSNPVHFDPYPYILLNLILSCIAAIQAPIIMMSQNRQETKDRLRGEHDYQVNLKAELEIRQLHMKIDQLLKHQWKRLLEIQQLQLEFMQESHRAKQTDPKK